MGLLSLGTPLSWDESIKYADHVRNEGIKQFINAFDKGQSYNSNYWSWGDEIEYVLVDMDDQEKRAYLSLKAESIIHHIKSNPAGIDSIWNPEYAKFMLESTPLVPYPRAFQGFLTVEENMRKRRTDAAKFIGKNDRILSIANFPRLGTVSAFRPLAEFSNEASRSCFIPDEVINSHARFRTLTRNIRHRRGQKVEISLPLYQDERTDSMVSSKLPCWFPDESVSSLFLEPNQVYMDCMAFGMGCCCLQMTMMTADMSEARFIYDQFAVMAPIMLALTAASPVFRGVLVDTDCRWAVIESSVDDRTREESGVDPLLTSSYRIQKSRYASVSRFISELEANRPEFNDLDTPFNPQAYEALIRGGVDDVLAKHIAHLFIRDPLVVFNELLNQDNAQSMDHFENIQSTNWQTCRFKPPSLTDSNLGWRVEFRPMEVQLSDLHNAAFVIYSVLLARALVHFKAQAALYVPLSLVDLNMARAQRRDAVLNEKFYFRSNWMSEAQEPCSIVLLSCDEIVNDPEIGTSAMIRRYLLEMNVEEDIFNNISKYIDLVGQRAAGLEPTPAKIIRDFVLDHPNYAKDSIVTDEINYDLINKLSEMN